MTFLYYTIWNRKTVNSLHIGKNMGSGIKQTWVEDMVPPLSSIHVTLGRWLKWVSFLRCHTVQTSPWCSCENWVICMKVVCVESRICEPRTPLPDCEAAGLRLHLTVCVLKSFLSESTAGERNIGTWEERNMGTQSPAHGSYLINVRWLFLCTEYRASIIFHEGCHDVFH